MLRKILHLVYRPDNTYHLSCPKFNPILHNFAKKTIKDKWDVPWMTSSIKKLIRKKQRAYNTSKKYDTPENRTRFKNLRKLVQSELKNSKNEYLMGLLEISNNSNKAVDQVKSAESTNYSVGKRFWSYIKSLKTNGSGVNTVHYLLMTVKYKMLKVKLKH